MISAPVDLITLSLLHGTLSWSETQHLRTAGPDEWVQHLTNIQGRWLAAHLGGVALFPLLGMTIWWMLPPLGLASRVSKIALILYMPLYVAVDAVLGLGSSVLVQYREGLAPSDRAGADGALEALFYEPSAIDWLDRIAPVVAGAGSCPARVAWGVTGPALPRADRGRPFLGQRGQHVQPVHLRHPHIEEHQIVGAGAQAFQGVHGVLRRRDRESGGLQDFRQELTRRPVIFDDQDAAHGPAASAACGVRSRAADRWRDGAPAAGAASHGSAHRTPPATERVRRS